MQSQRLVFYGGKGGVGKTTCAAARAIAEAGRGQRVLLVSTDPAHSLGDALRTRLTNRPTRVTVRRVGPGRLLALELNARRAFARWLGRHRRPLGDILEQGTWLDREDVDALLDLSLPGIDELAALLEIARLSRTRLSPSGIADVIVVDTAPTGHTLRLIAAPETVGAVARVLDALHEEHRLIRDQLARVGRPEASDRLIALLAGQGSEMAAQLRDRNRTTMHWVTLPEAMSVAESGDAVSSLARSGLHIEEIIVNRVLPDGGPCPLCDRRRAVERRMLAEIRRGIGRGRQLRVVPAEIQEPTGVKALEKIGGSLVGRTPARIRPVRSVRFQAEPRGPAKAGHSVLAASETCRGAKFLFFGGKGGVGKTTVAAATALTLARADRSRRVLLISTDPAHSLADALEIAVGDTPTTIAGAPGNLQARELDADRAYAARRAAIEEAIGDLAETRGSSALGANAARISELLDLAPPGVDELFGVLSILDARSDFDTIVIDTAPTGHTLRLLAMPELVREWVQALLRVLLKYRQLVKPGPLAAELVGLSRSIGELGRVLHQRDLTRFIVVTRPAELALAETVRLLRELRRLRIAVPAVVANALTLSPGRCSRCRATAAAERRHLARLRRTLGPSTRRTGGSLRAGGRGCAIIQTPLLAPPPRGARALEAWASGWVKADS